MVRLDVEQTISELTLGEKIALTAGNIFYLGYLWLALHISNSA